MVTNHDQKIETNNLLKIMPNNNIQVSLSKKHDKNINNNNKIISQVFYQNKAFQNEDSIQEMHRDSLASNTTSETVNKKIFNYKVPNSSYASNLNCVDLDTIFKYESTSKNYKQKQQYASDKLSINNTNNDCHGGGGVGGCNGCGGGLGYSLEMVTKPIEDSYSSDNQHEHYNSNLKSNRRYSASLSELDNIKKQTINNLKTYRTKFLSINTKFKSKFMNKLAVRNSKKPYLERLIRKNGDANINRINIESHRRKYMSDLFNTVIDMKWRYILLMFSMSFFASWLFFAILWFLISKYSSQQCISNFVDSSSFYEAFLFSIETQQTIGYGYRYITNNCKFSMIVLMFQCGFSVLLESFMGGVVFAKLSRPKKRTETLIFSKKAVISQRDGVYCLMCRVGDLRKSHIIQAYVRMYLIRTRYTQEGEIIPCNSQELAVYNFNSTDRLLFMPTIIEHVIDESSPLFELVSFKDSSFKPPKFESKNFISEDFEILVTLEGTVESTGASTQARTSFLPSEILWDHVFEPLFDINGTNSKATIDFSKFNNTKKINSNNNNNKKPTNNKQIDSTRTSSNYNNNGSYLKFSSFKIDENKCTRRQTSNSIQAASYLRQNFYGHSEFGSFKDQDINFISFKKKGGEQSSSKSSNETNKPKSFLHNKESSNDDNNNNTYNNTFSFDHCSHYCLINSCKS